MSRYRPVEVASFAGAPAELRWARVRRVMCEEVHAFHPRVRLAELLLAPLLRKTRRLMWMWPVFRCGL